MKIATRQAAGASVAYSPDRTESAWRHANRYATLAIGSRDDRADRKIFLLKIEKPVKNSCAEAGDCAVTYSGMDGAHELGGVAI